MHSSPGELHLEVPRVLVCKGEKPIVFAINDRTALSRGVVEKVIVVKGVVSNYSHAFNWVKQYQMEVLELWALCSPFRPMPRMILRSSSLRRRN